MKKMLLSRGFIIVLFMKNPGGLSKVVVFSFQRFC